MEKYQRYAENELYVPRLLDERQCSIRGIETDGETLYSRAT